MERNLMVAAGVSILSAGLVYTEKKITNKVIDNSELMKLLLFVFISSLGMQYVMSMMGEKGVLSQSIHTGKPSF